MLLWFSKIDWLHGCSSLSRYPLNVILRDCLGLMEGIELHCVGFIMGDIITGLHFFSTSNRECHEKRENTSQMLTFLKVSLIYRVGLYCYYETLSEKLG